jgi:peroxiredoxin
MEDGLMPRTENSRTLFFISAEICLILLLSVGQACAVNTAPDFTLTNLEGQKVTLSSYRGKVVVLNFWGTWCEPCKAEMPSLNKLYLEHRDKGLAVLAISIDPSEQNVKSFISQKGYSIPVLIDNKKEVFFDTYGLFGLPVSLIIGRDGTIVQKVVGETAWDSPQMEEKIQKLLGGR